jgi:small neutral amino acid transporter SnatA (MarC family)
VISYAKKIETFLGKTIINMFTRFMGLMVGAIAVQFIISGARELWIK